MYYIKQTQEDIDFSGTEIVTLYQELDEWGNSIREIGFDERQSPIYKFPGNGKDGTYGLFEFSPYSTKGLQSDLTRDDFEKLWSST